MAKFERTAVSLGAYHGNPVPGAGKETARGRRGSHFTGTAPQTGRQIPDLPPPAGPLDPNRGAEAVASRGSMTVRSSQRERETSGTLDGVTRRRPRVLTPEDRDIVAVRIRELKREAIPTLLRAMQSRNPDPIDRERYHRATNELDWLLEIVEHSARLDRISGPRHRGLRGPITTEEEGRIRGNQERGLIR
jgi:hypothetical protein